MRSRGLEDMVLPLPLPTSAHQHLSPLHCHMQATRSLFGYHHVLHNITVFSFSMCLNCLIRFTNWHSAEGLYHKMFMFTLWIKHYRFQIDEEQDLSLFSLSLMSPIYFLVKYRENKMDLVWGMVKVKCS